jgi:hypothetical protein
MNVAELMQELEMMEPEAEIRFAHQPSYPMQHNVEGVVEITARGECFRPTEPDPQDFRTMADWEEAMEQHEEVIADIEEREHHTVVYIVDGGQVYNAPYLPGPAAREIGW